MRSRARYPSLRQRASKLLRRYKIYIDRRPANLIWISIVFILGVYCIYLRISCGDNVVPPTPPTPTQLPPPPAPLPVPPPPTLAPAVASTPPAPPTQQTSTLAPTTPPPATTTASKPPLSCPEIFSKIFGPWLPTYRKCLTDNAKWQNNTYWTHLHLAIDKCLGDTMWRLLDINRLGNGGNVKFAMLRLDDPKSDKCTVITLGIGYDIEAEKKLRDMVPNCKFYGADPVVDAGNAYLDIGTFYSAAVSDIEGVLKANVMVNKTHYRWENVSSITLVDLLKTYIQSNKVDYMFVNMEGTEYRLIPQFLKGGPIEKEQLSICQLSIEFHEPSESNGVTAATYENLISGLISNSPFLPLSSAASKNLVQSFYMNVENAYCVEKFLQPRFCWKKE